MRLEPLDRTWKFALYIALRAVNIVSEDVKPCSIALGLNGHGFLRLWRDRVTQVRPVPERIDQTSTKDGARRIGAEGAKRAWSVASMSR